VRALRALAAALLAALVADLLVVLITGTATLLGPKYAPVGPLGFAVRAGAIGSLLLARFRLLAPRANRPEGGLLVLVLLLLPTLGQFHFAGGRINGDGLMYYPYVRSLWKDLDLDFTNEYTHFGLIRRGDLAQPTKTGMRRSIFSIGPAVVWTPFFLLGEGVGRAQTALGRPTDLSGYGPCHRNAVALGSLLYGFSAVLLIHALLRRYFAAGIALSAALLAWGATFLHWYMVHQPTMSHAPSTFAVAVVLWLWDRDRERREARGQFLLGLALGLAMCIRWQNGIFLILPAIEWLARLRKTRAVWWEALRSAAALGTGCLLGALPQLMAWKVIYGEWLLRYPPHGADFLRLDHPFVLETLFSTRHGLLSWTPVFWAGFLGLVPLVRRRGALGWPLVLPVVLMTYVNMCSGDWWAGGSFSNRRFDSLLPPLALGVAAALETARAWLARWPEAAPALAAAVTIVWNVALVEQVRLGLTSADATTDFPRLAARSVAVFSASLGSPPTWPASWLFAWRRSRPPSQYDLLVGRYLFYRQNNLDGRIPLTSDAEQDVSLLGEGWGCIEIWNGAPARRVMGRARLFAPLDAAEDLEIDIRVASEAALEILLEVNGRVAGRIRAGTEWTESRVRVDADLWGRELNDVVLDADGREVIVGAVSFHRPSGGRGQ
jgi:hypothetical protein